MKADYYNELNKDDKALLLNTDIVFDKDTTEEEMKAVLLAAKNQVGSVSIPLDMVSSLNETILAGKDINKNDWEALLATIPESAQNILGERDDFNNKGIADRLHLIQHLIQEVNKKILNNSLQ